MLNKRDHKIIAHLRSNARKRVTEIAEETGIPATTIYGKIEELHRTKIIKKYISLVNFSKIGFPIVQYIAFRVNKDDKEKIQGYLLSQQLNSIYKINFGYDFLVEGVFESLKDAEDFVFGVEQKFRIEEKKIMNVVEELKKEEFLCEERKTDNDQE